MRTDFEIFTDVCRVLSLTKSRPVIFSDLDKICDICYLLGKFRDSDFDYYTAQKNKLIKEYFTSDEIKF